MTASESKGVLQVGSNLFELIEFTVTRPRNPNDPAAGNVPAKPMVYGVNVAKVREVIRLPEITPCLTTTPEVLGVCNLRGVPVPAIHLARSLGYQGVEVHPSDQMIVTEIAQRLAAFIVSGTRRIRRVSWDKILPPSSDAFSSITGMMLIENNEFLFMIDYEQILYGIDAKSGRSSLSSSSHKGGDGEERNAGQGSRQRTPKPVVMVVDDSAVARRTVTDILKGVGLRVVDFPDGEQAWKALHNESILKDMGRLDAIISDVEMPRMDGYSLVKMIRSHPHLSQLPVILHTSLTGLANVEKASEVGATAYVNKFNRRDIVDAMRKILGDELIEKEAA